LRRRAGFAGVALVALAWSGGDGDNLRSLITAEAGASHGKLGGERGASIDDLRRLGPRDYSALPPLLFRQIVTSQNIGYVNWHL
jgi:hypothetical protein